MSLEHKRSIDLRASSSDASSSAVSSNEATKPETYDQHAAEDTEESSATSTAASWSQDLRIIPTLSIVFTLLNLDRSAVVYSNDNTTDLFGTSQGTSKVYQGTFYAGFILFVLPSVLLQRKISARIVLPALMAGWGAMTMIQAAVSTWAGLAAVQFFLGAFQAGFWAGVLVFVSSIYQSHQLGFRLALIFGLGMVLSSFNRSFVVLAKKNSSSLAGWKLLGVAEGAVTVGLAPLAFLLLPRNKAESDAGDDSSSLMLETMSQPGNIAFAFLGLLLGICGKTCEKLIFQTMWTLQTGTGSEAVLNVAAYALGFFILIFVAGSSDFYRERSTHLGVPLLVSLVILVNMTLAYYINKRPPAEFDAFILATTVFISPVFHSWYLSNTASNAARVAMAGLVVTTYHIGELVGWLIFMNAKLSISTPKSGSGGSSSSSSSSGSGTGSAHSKRTVEGNDLDFMKITAGFMAATILLTFALGAWHKRETSVNRYN